MRSLTLVPAVAAIAVGSCAQQPQPPGAALAQTLAGRVPGPPQECISEFGPDHPYAIDAQTIAYGSGRTIYINRLAGPCPGVDPVNTLITETYGGEYCRGDHIRGKEIGSIIPGPVCILQNWVPYRLPR
jgi:hypothetical protein